MRWTRWWGMVAGLGALSGCVYGYQTVAHESRYSRSSRPDASYYCYDCHGYRYFDPYYDWCADYGFRYRWTDHPRVISLYRQRYVRIKETHPEYGRYRYRSEYRRESRYRDARDYDAWRREQRPPDVGERRDRKQIRKKEVEQPVPRGKSKGREGKGARDRESRRSPPGGSS